MPEYLSPGVYVEDVPPLARPIAGVGTSTAGFIGILSGCHHVAGQTYQECFPPAKPKRTLRNMNCRALSRPMEAPETFEVRVGGKPVAEAEANEQGGRSPRR